MEVQKDKNLSLLYGSVELEGWDLMFHSFSTLRVKRVWPEEKGKYYTMRVDDDFFYGEYIPIGKYVIDSVDIVSGRQTLILDLSESKNKYAFEINSPGIFFLGSYTFKAKKKLFGLSDMWLEPAKTQKKHEVLRKIVKYAKETKWEAEINKELQKVKPTIQKKDGR